MLFNSLSFLIFFPIAILIYYACPKRVRYIWLLACSYYFYMSWNPEYALLILASTVITYVGSLIIGSESFANKSDKKRKAVLIAVLLSNLFILGFFKYSGLLIDSVVYVFGKLGIYLTKPTFDIILPVGISFYTFQALSYSIDVYKGEFKPEKNFFKYALFVSFFPQLVAGPIERSKNLLGQIQKVHEIKFNIEKIYHGLLTMLWGFFLKMVIADRLSILVDGVYARFYIYGGAELLFTALAFTIQLYCDFASYSTIAIGAAEVLGFTLMENFDAPHLSMSIKEFWRRWHISLSSWFKDYLYIPMGGSRVKKGRRYFNLMVTFLVSGLWHGASWNYVIWGGIHGLYQIIGELLMPVRNKIRGILGLEEDCATVKVLRTATTFLLVALALVVFRAPNMSQAISFLKRIVVDFDPWILFTGGLYELGLDRPEMNIAFCAVVLMVIADVIKYKKRMTIVDAVLKKDWLFQIVSVTALLMVVFIFGVYGPAFDAQAFIYFQF